jgi:hypothetical protein
VDYVKRYSYTDITGTLMEGKIQWPCSFVLDSHTSHLTPHTSHLTPHTSHLTPHIYTSHLTPHTSHLTPHTSHLTPHIYTSHLTPHISHLIPQTSSLTPIPGQTEDSWPSAPCNDDTIGGTPVRTATYGSYYDSAAGDFCLLPSRVMHQIRGFAEIPNNIFMDGTAIHAAAAHGFGQQVFKPPCSIYHQVATCRGNSLRAFLSFLYRVSVCDAFLSGPSPKLQHERHSADLLEARAPPSHTHFL